jgi:formylglycine-generating enzyme required for sulfatase activity
MRLSFVRLVIFVAALLAGAASSAAQEAKRFALLIGNEAYDPSIGRLANPHNDVAALEQALKGLGFVVTVERDAGLGALTRAVNAYARRLQAAGPDAIGLFYYSGHGASDGSTNYLIPVDVKTTEAGELWDESLRLTEITRKLKAEAGNATHFVVFDACRNTLKLTRPGSRAVVQSKGFVPVAQENGMLIAYATAEGELASDVGTAAGPYAKALAEEIVKPGIEAVVMFRAVQRRVRAAIHQEPYLGFNALGDVYLAGKAIAAVLPSVPPPLVGEAAQAWSAAKDMNSVKALEDFMVRYKDTYYAFLAQLRLEELKKQQAEGAHQTANAAKNNSDNDAHAMDEAERIRLALLQRQEDDKKRVEAEAAKKRERTTDAASPGSVFRDCPDCPEMVVIPTGQFMMGEGHEQHKVMIRRPFAVGKFSVTFEEWDACGAAGGCSGNRMPSDQGWGRGRRPVMNTSWNDAKEYVSWLSSKTGKTYRLLSEAEWEYAAGAGTTTRYSWGDDIGKGNANCDRCGSQWDNKQTAPVGSFKPNAWGLYDMHGNVWQWTEDSYHNSYNGAPSDGSAWLGGTTSIRGMRGGCWNYGPVYVRSASRWLAPTYRDSGVGFRVAKTL